MNELLFLNQYHDTIIIVFSDPSANKVLIQKPSVMNLMKTIFRREYLPVLFLLVISNLFAQKSQTGQSDFYYRIANDLQTSETTFEFDLLLLDTDASQPFELASVQAGILMNPGVYNGGTLSASIVPGTSALNSSQQPSSITFTQSANVIKLASKAPPGAGNGSIISSNPSVPTRICRIKMTNSVPWAQAQPDLTFSFTTIPYPTKISQYISGINTALPINSGNCFSVCTNNQLNPPPVLSVTPLNQVVTSDSGSVSFNVFCNSSWSVSSDQSWCTLNPTSGYGNGTVIASFPQNESLSARQSYLTFIVNGLQPLVDTLTQSGLVTRVLNLHVLLEGLYSADGTMHPAMNETEFQWGPDIADKISVEFHDASNYGVLLYSSPNLDLNVDGNVSLNFPAGLNGNYYISIHHRNSIEIVSANPISFSGITTDYSFNNVSKAYGGNLKYVPDGYFVMYGGDINQDGIVDSGDMIPIDNQSANFTTGYLVEDANGDGLIDLGDMIIVDNNSANFITALTPPVFPIFTCGSSLTIEHILGDVAPENKTVTYGTVTGIPGEPYKCWITSNLGADHEAISVDDTSEASAGWYWQFNRKQGFKHDGANWIPNVSWITSITEDNNWQPSNDPCALLGCGWRIPTYTEWKNVDSIGNWNDFNLAWNSGLKLHAAGNVLRSNGSLENRGEIGSYWSGTQIDAEKGWNQTISSWTSFIGPSFKADGFTIRCIQDLQSLTPTVVTATINNITPTSATGGGAVISDGESTVIARGVCWSNNPNPTIFDSHTSDGIGNGTFASSINGLNPNTTYYVRAFATNSNSTGYGNEISFTTQPELLIDIEGNIYETIVIGTQVWMNENLKVTKYRNGISIPNVTDPNSWIYLSNGAFCLYDNDTTYKNTYGALYNWYAVVDNQYLCPTGWHIPSEAEWTILTDYLGSDNAGCKMKSTRTQPDPHPRWNNPNSCATNVSGFTGLPGGGRVAATGEFTAIGNYGYWWSSTQTSSTDAGMRHVSYDSGTVDTHDTPKKDGISVRCLKD